MSKSLSRYWKWSAVMRKISKKEKEKRKLIAFRVMIALLCIAVALVFIRSYYIKN